jgi:hypothetical protein
MRLFIPETAAAFVLPFSAAETLQHGLPAGLHGSGRRPMLWQSTEILLSRGRRVRRLMRRVSDFVLFTRMARA